MLLRIAAKAPTARAVEPETEPKQFWMDGSGAKNFQMVEPEPEI